MSEHGFLSPNPALFEIEQLKKRPGLAHELGQGAPCLNCKDKCPGFQLHYWRKVCMNCRCGKAEHNVIEADPGFFIVGKLFDRPLRTKEEELHFVYGDVFGGLLDTSQAGKEIKLDWVPPGTSSNVVAKYLKSMPQQYVSIQGSEGAHRRKKQLEKQFPIHDVEPTNCHELTSKEIDMMQSYVESVRQNIAGQGRVLEIGGSSTSVQSSNTAVQSVHSSGYLSGGSSQDNINAWCQEDEGAYSNIPPPPPPEVMLAANNNNGHDLRGDSESPPPPPLPSSMPPMQLTGIDLKQKFDAIGLSGRNGPNQTGMFHATPYQGQGFTGGSTGSSIPSNSSSPSPPKTSPSFRSEIHREIPAFIGLSPTPPHGRANMESPIAGSQLSANGSQISAIGSQLGSNVLPTSPKPSIIKPAKLIGGLKNGAINSYNNGGKGGMTNNGGFNNGGNNIGSAGSSLLSGIGGNSEISGQQKTNKDQVSWNCSGCNELMVPGAVAIFAERAGQDKCWHPACFSCCSCGELLEDLLYFYSKGKLYCGRDFARMMDIPRCAACDELIFATEYTGADDQYWHLKHFCCYTCDTPLAGHKYIPVNGQPHCLTCWQNIHGKVCNTCESYIHPEDKRVTLGDSHWHAKSECFRCGVCSKSLLGGKMTRKNGTLLCSSVCAAKLVATTADLPTKSALNMSTKNAPKQNTSAQLHHQEHTHAQSVSSSQLRNSSSQSSSRTQSPLPVMPGQHVASGQLMTSNGQLGGHFISSGQILGNRPGPQTASAASRLSASSLIASKSSLVAANPYLVGSLATSKPSSPVPPNPYNQHHRQLGSPNPYHQGPSASPNPCHQGPPVSPIPYHQGHPASPTHFHHHNRALSSPAPHGSNRGMSPVVSPPPPPPPKPGMTAGNLLPYQPLLHIQQNQPQQPVHNIINSSKPAQQQAGRHVQFASSTRSHQQQDQSSDGYSSNHSTPPFHSRESSYSTIV